MGELVLYSSLSLSLLWDWSCSVVDHEAPWYCYCHQAHLSCGGMGGIPLPAAAAAAAETPTVVEDQPCFSPLTRAGRFKLQTVKQAQCANPE